PGAPAGVPFAFRCRNIAMTTKDGAGFPQASMPVRESEAVLGIRGFLEPSGADDALRPPDGEHLWL
ncbi:hypothetical protein ACFFQG_08675, partial [Shinella granuli]|uniref:hypothetical protein n=1 Tax=Shinella granuli TaxID=323621 RepID=UPI0035E90576